jgi:hypothetical protein
MPWKKVPFCTSLLLVEELQYSKTMSIHNLMIEIFMNLYSRNSTIAHIFIVNVGLIKYNLIDLAGEKEVFI